MEEHPRNEIIQVVVSTKEKELIEEAAQKEDRKVSNFIRNIILDKIKTSKMGENDEN